jgi:hypothetical protein
MMRGHDRAAVEGQLWGPALLLARSCGDKAFSDAAAAMAAAAFVPGTPLHSLSHVLAGRQDLVLPVPGGPASASKKSGPASGGGFGLKALLTSSPVQVRLPLTHLSHAFWPMLLHQLQQHTIRMQLHRLQTCC